MTAIELVHKLDELNLTKWKSLKGTSDEFKHCGLSISDKEWQAIREEVLNK